MDENARRRPSLRIKTLNFDYSSNNSAKKIQWNISSESKGECSKKLNKKEQKTPYTSYVKFPYKKRTVKMMFT